MSGLCGWIAGGERIARPGDVLRRMTAGLPQGWADVTESIGRQRFGLAVQSHPALASWFADARLAAAIEGYPSWTDGSIAAIAKQQGHARALAAAYDRFGLDLFDHLRGSFVLALIDAAATKALVAIDRLGVHSLCFAQPSADVLVFGTTTDSVGRHPLVTSTLSTQSIYDYFYFIDRIPAPSTIYKEQIKLLPGQYICFEAGSSTVGTYWRMPYRENGARDEAELCEELMFRLRAAVKRSLGDEDRRTVGAFLSGGLDSSTVVGLASELLGPFNTFSIGFDVDGFDETEYAKIVSNHFNTKSHIYYNSPEDILSSIIEVSEYYDEPFANSSAIPSYYCARFARQHGTDMLLAGDGGDEIFAGNSRYVKDRIFDLWSRLPGRLRDDLIAPVIRKGERSTNLRLFKKLSNYISLGGLSVAERMSIDNVYRSADPGEIFQSDFCAAIDPDAPKAFARAVYDSADAGSKLNRMLNFDLRITLADSDLRKVSRTCELAGVRVRYPMLDDDLVEFAASIPPHIMLKGGKLRYLYKKAVEGFLPNQTLTKKKHGFGIPALHYINKSPPLSDFICDVLGGLKQRPYFRKSFVDRLIAMTRRGETHELHGIVWDAAVFELWLRSRLEPVKMGTGKPAKGVLLSADG